MIRPFSVSTYAMYDDSSHCSRRRCARFSSTATSLLYNVKNSNKVAEDLHGLLSFYQVAFFLFQLYPKEQKSLSDVWTGMTIKLVFVDIYSLERLFRNIYKHFVNIIA